MVSLLIPHVNPQVNGEVLKLRLTENLRVVALGDSSVFGVGDTCTEVAEKYLGWAGRFSHDLGANKYVNLGKNGARFRTLVRSQLNGALAMKPHIALICIGTNDVLRGNFSPSEIEICATNIISALRKLGTTVVFVGIPDPVKTAPGPMSLRKILQRRVRLVNWITEEVVTAKGGIYISTWNHDMAYNRNMWHVDHMHPSSLGHQEIADLVRRNLGLPRKSENRLGVQKAADKKFEIYWLLTSGLKWFAKRSIDLIPGMIWLIVSEKWGRRF